MGLGATLYRLRWRLFVFLVLSYAIAITIYLLPHHETRPFSIPRPPKRAPPPLSLLFYLSIILFIFSILASISILFFN